MSSDGRLAFALVMVAVVGCKGRDRHAPEPAAHGSALDVGIDRDAAAHQRNVALRSEPFDYQMTATACSVPVPSPPNVTAIDVADLDTAPPTHGDPARGYEAIVVAEAKAVNHEIGRILIWDRAAKKFVCGNAYEERGDGAAALAHAKLFELAPVSSVKPTIPDAMAPRTGEKVLRVAIGSNHFCALLEDGSVRCFGQNDAGQCTAASRGPVLVAKPVAVPHVTDAIDIVAGSDHTCVRRKSGAITCWGGNTFGELGPGGDNVRTVTRSVGATTQLAIGADHTCALRTDGSVVCWGDSGTTRGETKARPEDERDPTPRPVAGLPPVAEICALPVDSCARLRAGGIMCWGSRYGTKPVRLDGSDNATSLACGAEASEVCWVDGSNAPTCASENQPVALPPLHDVARIAFGSDHACALHVDGTVECWGKNEYGQLGTGTVDHPTGPVPLRPVAGSPQPVHPLRAVKQLAIGSMRTAAILADDALAVWGYGPIGDGRDCSGPPCDGLVPTEISFTR